MKILFALLIVLIPVVLVIVPCTEAEFDPVRHFQHCKLKIEKYITTDCWGKRKRSVDDDRRPVISGGSPHLPVPESAFASAGDESMGNRLKKRQIYKKFRDSLARGVREVPIVPPVIKTLPKTSHDNPGFENDEDRFYLEIIYEVLGRNIRESHSQSFNENDLAMELKSCCQNNLENCAGVTKKYCSYKYL